MYRYNTPPQTVKTTYMKPILLFICWLYTAPIIGQLSNEVPVDHVYRLLEVDQKPELADGMYTLAMFVGENFQLPELHNKKIKLFMGFVVELDGSISQQRFIHMDVKPLHENLVVERTPEEKQREKELLATLDEEALRVLLLFEGKWKPALKDGIPVRCQYNVPFNLSFE